MEGIYRFRAPPPEDAVSLQWQSMLAKQWVKFLRCIIELLTHTTSCVLCPMVLSEGPACRLLLERPNHSGRDCGRLFTGEFDVMCRYTICDGWRRDVTYWGRSSFPIKLAYQLNGLRPCTYLRLQNGESRYIDSSRNRYNYLSRFVRENDALERMKGGL